MLKGTQLRLTSPVLRRMEFPGRASTPSVRHQKAVLERYSWVTEQHFSWAKAPRRFAYNGDKPALQRGVGQAGLGGIARFISAGKEPVGDRPPKGQQHGT